MPTASPLHFDAVSICLRPIETASKMTVIIIPKRKSLSFRNDGVIPKRVSFENIISEGVSYEIVPVKVG